MLAKAAVYRHLNARSTVKRNQFFVGKNKIPQFGWLKQTQSFGAISKTFKQISFVSFFYSKIMATSPK